MEAKIAVNLLTQDGMIRWAEEKTLTKEDFKDFPNNLYNVSKETWYSYEALRRSGMINMWESKEFLGLTSQEFYAIIQHYKEMNEIWKGEFEKTGIEIIGPQMIVRKNK